MLKRSCRSYVGTVALAVVRREVKNRGGQTTTRATEDIGKADEGGNWPEKIVSALAHTDGQYSTTGSPGDSMLHGALFERPGHCQVCPTEDTHAHGWVRAGQRAILLCTDPAHLGWLWIRCRIPQVKFREVNHTPRLKRQRTLA